MAAKEEVAAALQALVERAFPRSRGRESRVEAYLALNALLQVEDSPASVRALRTALPALLGEFRFDLELATARDVVHACLRTLSYFMYHGAMADAFPETQASFFLSEIVRLLFSTQDEVRCHHLVEKRAAVLTPLVRAGDVQAVYLVPRDAELQRVSTPTAAANGRGARAGHY